jgi:hypothetical protein
MRAHPSTNWTYVETIELHEGIPYFMKCRPGGPCGAIVDENPEVDPPWEIVGELTLPTSKMSAGPYEVFCRTGFGQKCQVLLQAVDEGGEGQ